MGDRMYGGFPRDSSSLIEEATELVCWTRFCAGSERTSGENVGVRIAT